MWQRSCFIQRHNLVSRGERELRGERHGKGGRSLSTTTAPSFFMATLFSLLFAASAKPAESQARIEVHVGYGASGTVVTDGIATPVLSGNLGNIDVQPVTAKFKPAPEAGVGVVLPLGTGTKAIARASFSPSTLRATERGVERDVQDVTVLQGLLALRREVGSVVEIGAGLGATYLAADDRALLRGGSSIAPVLELMLGAGRNIGEHRMHIGAVTQLERFSSQALIDSRGNAANVMRYALRGSMTWGGAR